MLQVVVVAVAVAIAIAIAAAVTLPAATEAAIAMHDFYSFFILAVFLYRRS